MSATHIADIFFDGKREYAKKRLQQLKAGEYIGERRRRVSEPSVLFLAAEGFRCLKGEGVLAEYPDFTQPALVRRTQVSDITLTHELSVMDVKAAFHRAIRDTPKLSIAEFSTWPKQNEFLACGTDGAEVLVRPDGFVRLHEKESDGTSEHTFFVEVDRSTETLDRLAGRARCYLHYYQSGGFAERNGATRSEFKEYPFRVLMVFKSAERRNNMAEQLLSNRAPILTQVYLSTLDEVKIQPLDSIWIRPIDYRDALSGTRFSISNEQTFGRGYRRNSDRELFVEQVVKTTRLLDDAV